MQVWPDLHAEVLAGDKSPHGAMVEAGFRPKTMTVPVDIAGLFEVTHPGCAHGNTRLVPCEWTLVLREADLDLSGTASNGEASAMKTAVRIVSAALALAAVITLPFVQPAQPAEAAGTIDLRVMFVNWDSHYVEPGIKRANFYIANLGSAPSVTLLAYRECTYTKMDIYANLTKLKVQVGTPTPMTLGAGEAKIFSVDCHRYNGINPDMVTVSATAGAGTDSNWADNKYEQAFPHPLGSQ